MRKEVTPKNDPGEQWNFHTCTQPVFWWPGGGCCFGPNFLLCSFAFFLTATGEDGRVGSLGSTDGPTVCSGSLPLPEEARTPFQTSKGIATRYFCHLLTDGCAFALMGVCLTGVILYFRSQNLKKYIC